MSKPNKCWYWCVRQMIAQYPDGLQNCGVMGEEFASAIEQAIGDTSLYPDGAERLKAVNLVCIKKTHTNAGAAYKIHTSERTIQTWISDFVKNVGENVGFK